MESIISNQMFQKRNATQRFCDLGLAAGEAPADAEPAQVLSKFREDPEATAAPQTGVCYKISPKVCLCIKDRLAEQWAVQKQLTCLEKVFFFKIHFPPTFLFFTRSRSPHCIGHVPGAYSQS